MVYYMTLYSVPICRLHHVTVCSHNLCLKGYGLKLCFQYPVWEERFQYNGGQGNVINYPQSAVPLT